ncbi:hypothetical protein TNCV_519551 [Trichonephila clavipes]|nr:hypothetical protein TNCV_519551 [Trichonephila clavipes]
MRKTPIHHWVEIDRDQADVFGKKCLGLLRSGSIVGLQYETTLGDGNTKPYFNSWLGALTPSGVTIKP